jgi:Peptidase S46
MTKRLALLLAVSAGLLCLADEGMWPVNQFPTQAVKQKYGFEVTDQFLKHIQRSSVRFNNGGSGSFISPEGLLFTNHHVGRDCIQKVSTADHDYVAQGFYAASAAEEKTCPDLEVNVLLDIQDVTAKVKEGEKPDADTAAVNQARKAAMARIEKECAARTGNRCDVVTLYSGGRYDLYQYKKYTDVRLVFAPEEGIAAFGGDPDNFNYPRYCLDFSLFRAYENGHPVDSKEYLHWSHLGVRDGELTFVAGNPGTTGRLMTMAQLEYSRDVSYPLIYAKLESMIKALKAYGAQSAENKRVAGDDLLSAQNSYKAYTGFLAGLRDPQLMARKRDEEQTLRSAVEASPEMRQKFGKVWDDVAAAYSQFRPYSKEYSMTTPVLSDLFNIARNVSRLPEEMKKPSDKRLREYRDSALPSLEQEIYSPAPISDSLEIAVLAEDFRFMQRQLGPDHELVKKVLDGKTPEQAAEMYVKSSKLKDVAERKRLAGDLKAVQKSDDGMIRLARILDSRNRELRKRYEDTIEATLTSSASKIAQARFATEGSNTYPDATFTFRIEYGPVKGYTLNGKNVPFATNFEGLYKRATGVDPFKLPPSWEKAKSSLNLSTPFDFVTTVDSHGGNSGSPTVNTKGELIGILFDGNIESLPNRFVYTDEVSRSVHVASQGIIEALRKVYKTDRLLKEIGMQ